MADGQEAGRAAMRAIALTLGILFALAGLVVVVVCWMEKKVKLQDIEEGKDDCP